MKKQNAIDVQGLALVVQELRELDEKPTLERRDRERQASLLAQAAAIKSGVRLKDLQRSAFNEKARANGLPEMAEEPTKRELRAQGWMEFFGHRNGDLMAQDRGAELRDMTLDAPGFSPASRIGTYNHLGFFVPTDFYKTIFKALKEHDALFDESIVTLIKSKNGRPLPVPVYGDTENVAAVITEATTSSETDISSTGQVVLGAWTYRTPRFALSLEAMQDVNEAETAEEMFRDFATDRFARGFGADLVTGAGTTKPLGLIPALIALSVTPIAAVGSGGNDGSGTNVNSIGSVDLAAAFAALDPAYMKSPKVRWLMNLATFGNLLNLSDKNGRPLKIVEYQNGSPTIYGIKIAICPSMDNIGASKKPIILGDCSYWATRLIWDEAGPFGIVTYFDTPGYAEYGKFGMRAFFRGDGALLWTDTSSPCPFVIIQNHS